MAFCDNDKGGAIPIFCLLDSRNARFLNNVTRKYKDKEEAS